MALVNKEEHIRKKRLFSRKSKTPQDKTELKKSIKELVTKCLAIVIIAYVLFNFIFGIAFLKNNNMAPSVKFGDVALYVRLYQKVKVNDVIFYKDNGVERMGRVIAQSGDEVSITDDGKISVNGHEREEQFPQATYAHSSGLTYPYIVPEKSYFVLFDNREEQTDSRYVGAISQEEITGIVTTLIRVRDI